MLTAGQRATSFTLWSQDNALVSLSDFKGRKVVIYFYPKDDTPGCTKQACHFRDIYDDFTHMDVTVIGISRDGMDSHKAFAEKYHLPFVLLADPDGAVIKAYGVRGLLGASRTTYIVDENGIIEKLFANANPTTNATEIISYLHASKNKNRKEEIE